MPTPTKTQKKKPRSPVKAKRTLKTARKPAAKRRARKPKLAALPPVEQAVDPKIVAEHLSSLRSLSELPPINLDDLIRNDQPYALMHLDESAEEEPRITLRSRISFYLGVFFGAVVVNVLVVVFLTAVNV